VRAGRNEIDTFVFAFRHVAAVEEAGLAVARCEPVRGEKV